MAAGARWFVVASSFTVGCSFARGETDEWERPDTSVTSAEVTGELPSDTSGGEQAVDERALFVATPSPPPITGGGVLVLADGNTVVVSDPERDFVHVVDLERGGELAAIDTGDGSMPWRTVEDPSGMVHVVLRGSGSVATIDPVAAELLETRAVCSHPRGIALAPGVDEVLMACASGDVMRMPFELGAPAERFATLEPDLRDVFVDAEGRIHVTRFRSAEVLRLDNTGRLAERTTAANWFESVQDLATMRASTAWRTVPLPTGGWLMAHQGGSGALIPVDDDLSTPYGGPEPCNAIVQSSVSIATDGRTPAGLGSLDRVSLPVDIALDPTGSYAVLASAASCPDGCGTAKIVAVDLTTAEPGVNPPCQGPIPIYYGNDDPRTQLIALAYTPDGRLLVQQRDPAALLIVVDELNAATILLEGDSLEDTGHRLFHEVGLAGITCASCHAEGGDDGLVWMLGDERHTPPLNIGLAGTTPFHWDGALHDFAALVTEVHEGRMGELLQKPERVAAFEDWVTHLEQAPMREPDETASAGRELFAERRCTTCHTGPALTNNQTVVAGSGLAVQVPPLRGVGLHPPYMHDGRAATLDLAVRDMLTRTVPELPIDDTEVAQLVAYLETL